MAKRMQGMVPQIGQLVGCWFPHGQSPVQPGQKFRPALVIGTNTDLTDEYPKVAVVYGTGQRTSSKSGPQLRAHEFELNRGEEGNSLLEETRFDCSRYVWLPFTEEWFKPPIASSNMFKGYGRVPKSRKEEIRAAVVEGRLKVGPPASKFAVCKPVVSPTKASASNLSTTLSLSNSEGPGGTEPQSTPDI